MLKLEELRYTSILLNLNFASNTILSCLCFFFLFSGSYILISAVITKIFIFTAELIIPTAIPTKEAKTENETHPVTIKTDSKVLNSKL